MNHSRNYRRVLSIAPCARGFGFAVLEERGLLLDWGVARLHSKSDEEFGARFDALLDKYPPELVVLEDVSAVQRSPRLAATLETAARLASLRDLRVLHVGRGDVRTAVGLSRKATNHEVATVTAELFPELLQHLPPKRQPWQGVDGRMYLFAAAALLTATVYAKPASDPLGITALGQR